jgi:hypothetical protein
VPLPLCPLHAIALGHWYIQRCILLVTVVLALKNSRLPCAPPNFDGVPLPCSVYWQPSGRPNLKLRSEHHFRFAEPRGINARLHLSRCHTLWWELESFASRCFRDPIARLSALNANQLRPLLVDRACFVTVRLHEPDCRQSTSGQRLWVSHFPGRWCLRFATEQRGNGGI